ncbi:MAG: hypothetical protein V1824_03595, partial [archaeon]
TEFLTESIGLLFKDEFPNFVNFFCAKYTLKDEKQRVEDYINFETNTKEEKLEKIKILHDYCIAITTALKEVNFKKYLGDLKYKEIISNKESLEFYETEIKKKLGNYKKLDEINFKDQVEDIYLENAIHGLRGIFTHINGVLDLMSANYRRH